MLIEVKVPILSESVSEATLSTWLKKPGDLVDLDENIVDIETDKVVLEIVAPGKGQLKEIRCGDGTNVKSDEVIAIIDTEVDASLVTQASESQPGSGNGSGNKEPDNEKVANEVAEASVTSIASKQADKEASGNSGHGLSPAVRKLITEYELDPNSMIGTGKDGRLTKSDVIKHIKSLSTRNQQIRSDSSASTEEVSPEATSQQQSPPQSQLKSESSLPAFASIMQGDRPEKRVPMSRLRRRVAERLKDAQNTAAILTTFNEVNMKPVMDLRSKYKDQFEKHHGTKLGFMSFFVRAVVESLKQHPVMNASIDETDIIYHGYFDIGIAVGSPRGLVVPILRDADLMSFAETEVAIRAYGQKAKDGKLSLDDLTGGTFSITNGGVYGSMMSTPILNPPQSAILGMHNIVERPVVENGEIVIRPMMYLAVSYDHRIIDGQDAVLFLVAIKQMLEDPSRMLLDI